MNTAPSAASAAAPSAAADDGIAAAMRFLQQLRQDEALRERLRVGQDDCSHTDLVALGAACGYRFDTAALAAAFRHDWMLRRMHYQRPAPPAERTPTTAPPGSDTAQ